MEEINLLQNRVKDTTHVWQKQSKFMITVLVLILLLVIAGSAGLFLLNRSMANKIAVVDSDNKALQQKLQSQQKDLVDAKSFQAQLANLKVLLGNHIYLSPLLNELSKFTYLKAQYTLLDVTEDGKVHLEGKVGNYVDLGKLILGLSTSSQFKNVKLLSVLPSTGTDNAYAFSIDLSASPDLFSKK